MGSRPDSRIGCSRLQRPPGRPDSFRRFVSTARKGTLRRKQTGNRTNQQAAREGMVRGCVGVLRKSSATARRGGRGWPRRNDILRRIFARAQEGRGNVKPTHQPIRQKLGIGRRLPQSQDHADTRRLQRISQVINPATSYPAVITAAHAVSRYPANERLSRCALPKHHQIAPRPLVFFGRLIIPITLKTAMGQGVETEAFQRQRIPIAPQ